MKTVLVVGGSRGIGAEIVNNLKQNHKVITFSRTPVENPEFIHHQLDVTKDELPNIHELDKLVYCPGSINLKTLTRLSTDDFLEDFSINVLGAVRVIKKYESQLSKNNGSVVLFSTVATQMGMPYHSSIAVSKAGVEGLAKSLAAEYATKIRFNVIAPTVTNTPLAARLLRNEKQQETIKERHPLKKYLEAKDVAFLVSYLLSEQAAAISGQVFPLDAGLVSLKL